MFKGLFLFTKSYPKLKPWNQIADELRDTFVKIQIVNMQSTVFKIPGSGDDKTTVINFLLELINTKGHSHYEEAVTQYQHAVQTAHLARISGASPELITASLLHDIGHLLVEGDFRDGTYNEMDHLHENLAADFLASFYPPSVTDPIRLHVAAKRYLVSTEPAYYFLLSDASRQSYYLQGGAMQEAEIKEFESHPHCREAVQLRRWDDQAKELSAVVEPAESYQIELITALL